MYVVASYLAVRLVPVGPTLSKWFYDTFTGIVTRAVCYGSLLERA
jgi:hypothetical protein